MADPTHARGQLAWLEVEGGSGGPQRVDCPRAEASTELRECLACKRFTTLAIHPSGKHVYVLCEPHTVLPGEGDS